MTLHTSLSEGWEDRQGGAGWDLVCRLVREKNQYNRGRLSASGALRHRYFTLPDL